jgi:hypothetical protein
MACLERKTCESMPNERTRVTMADDGGFQGYHRPAIGKRLLYSRGNDKPRCTGKGMETPALEEGRKHQERK